MIIKTHLKNSAVNETGSLWHGSRWEVVALIFPSVLFIKKLMLDRKLFVGRV